VGKYNFLNFLAAITFGTIFKVENEKINEAISNYVPTNNRSQVQKTERNTLIIDCYNANPSSMRLALESFKEIQNPKKLAILGDMFELGDLTESEHKLLGQLIAGFNFSKVLLVGEHMQHALNFLPQAYYFPDKFGLHNWLQDHPITDSYLLVKGSRGIQLESVLPFLKA
jgi:UDP-N-acetylmuramoyl-tripeptide--D-alanyl-D-alanine ligase